MNSTALAAEIGEAFYQAHKAEFHEKYYDKWLVIYGNELIGAYDTMRGAVDAALPRFGDEEFLLHRPANDGTVFEIGPIISDGKDIGDDGTLEIIQGELRTFTYA